MEIGEIIENKLAIDIYHKMPGYALSHKYLSYTFFRILLEQINSEIQW